MYRLSATANPLWKLRCAWWSFWQASRGKCSNSSADWGQSLTNKGFVTTDQDEIQTFYQSDRRKKNQRLYLTWGYEHAFYPHLTHSYQTAANKPLLKIQQNQRVWWKEVAHKYSTSLSVQTYYFYGHYVLFLLPFLLSEVSEESVQRKFCLSLVSLTHPLMFSLSVSCTPCFFLDLSGCRLHKYCLLVWTDFIGFFGRNVVNCSFPEH